MLLLVDLSNNNPDPIDFRALKRDGVFGVELKVTEGLSFVDETFERRARAARAAGLRVGGYHFARPEPGTAEREARYFLEHLGKIGRRDLRPALDLEVAPSMMHGEELRLWAAHFLARVHAGSGVRALTYTYSAFVAEQGWSRTFGTGAGLWLADYGPNDGHDHGARPPAPWRSIAAHQFTSVGRRVGVLGPVDLSHARSRRRVLAHPVRGLA